jgi:hypothetical protein
MATQIMLNGVTTYDNVRDIDAIVDEMEMGIFINSARLADQVLRDARIMSTVSTRIGGLLGKPLELEAAKPSDGRNKSTADRLAAECKTDWPKMFPHAELVQFIEWGLMHNSGVAQVIEDTDPWTIEVWHPWALAWDEYLRQYYIQTREEGRLYILPDGKGGFRDENGTRWMLFTPFGFGNTRRNYLRCLHRLSNERQWSHRDRARFSEIFGQGIRLGIAPENASNEDIAKYKQKLRLGGEPVVVVRQGPEGKKWGLEIIQSNGTESTLFDTTLTQLDKEIATLFLGQSQTTDGQAGLGANEMAGEPVRLDMMMADNQGVSQTLREQFLMPYYEFTAGKAELAPVPCWRVVPPEDGAKKTLEFKQLMEGIAEALAAGIPIDVDRLLEKFGIPALTKEQQAALAAAVAQKQADAKKNGPQETPPAQPPSPTAV